MEDKIFLDHIKIPYRLIFRVHALRQMFSRRISDSEVREVIACGRIIEEYPDDRPYPSYLIFGEVNGRPLHVVGAYNIHEGEIIIITVYEPNPDQW
ncbi:DUF4258 domain-containing protein, partial [Methanocalculus sp.]